MGAAAGQRRYGDGGVTYSQDVGLDIAGTFLTQTLAVSEVNLLGLEAAVVWGSFHMQGEYTHVDAQLTAGGAADVEGGYVQVGYFLTGEHRGYKRSSNAFDRTKIIEPFFRVRTAEGICHGRGAWEIAYRWAMADLDDGALSSGGTYSNHTIGLNWYLNDYTRIMFF